jgi:hypothetical protein
VATGIAVAQANAILDALCRSVAYSDPAGFFLKLHIGDPGAAGTANVAAHTTRVAPTFSAASGGAITNSAAVTWASMSAAETISHWSAWDTVGPTGGTFLFSDNLTTARTVAIGDTFEIPIGDLDIDVSVLAA